MTFLKKILSTSNGVHWNSGISKNIRNKTFVSVNFKNIQIKILEKTFLK